MSSLEGFLFPHLLSSDWGQMWVPSIEVFKLPNQATDLWVHTRADNICTASNDVSCNNHFIKCLRTSDDRAANEVCCSMFLDSNKIPDYFTNISIFIFLILSLPHNGWLLQTFSLEAPSWTSGWSGSYTLRTKNILLSPTSRHIAAFVSLCTDSLELCFPKLRRNKSPTRRQIVKLKP